MKQRYGNNGIKNSIRKSVLLVLPLVTGLALAEPVYAKAKEKQGITKQGETIEVRAGKAFDKAKTQLGKLDDEARQALEEIKQNVVAVITGKEITVKKKSECEEPPCLTKKSIDIETGEVDEGEEKGISTEYSFSLGSKQAAQRFGAVLKSELKGMKITVLVEGEIVTVKNMKKQVQEMAFEN